MKITDKLFVNFYGVDEDDNSLAVEIKNENGEILLLSQNISPARIGKFFESIALTYQKENGSTSSIFELKKIISKLIKESMSQDIVNNAMVDANVGITVLGQPSFQVKINGEPNFFRFSYDDCLRDIEKLKQYLPDAKFEIEEISPSESSGKGHNLSSKYYDY